MPKRQVADIDETIKNPKLVRLERMEDGCLWLAVTKGTQRVVYWIQSRGLIDVSKQIEPLDDDA